MAIDGSVAPSIISAVSGLVGVSLGSFLTWQREASRESDRIKKELNHLAILVVAHLDRFVDGCVHVAFDDGTSEGMATTSTPTFDPFELKVDWKVLPAQLMYGILNLPYQTEKLANRVSAVYEVDDPPDYSQTFWSRQHGFAVLGLEVSELARKLREHAGLPIDKPIEGKWNRDDALRKQRDMMASDKAAYDAQRAAAYKEILHPAPEVSA